MRFRFALFVFAAAICAPVFAQEPVVGVADPDALFHSKDKKLDRNLQSAYHIMLDLLECNQWDQADKWLTAAYHQHNPLAASGRDGVVHSSRREACSRPRSLQSSLRPRL